jgi:hypothetical protein
LAALEWYDKAIGRLAGAKGGGALLDALNGRAEALTALGNFVDGLAAWDTAIGVAEKEQAPNLRIRRARTLVAAGDPRRAAAEVRELVAPPTVTADVLDGAARVLALAAAAKTDAATADGYAADAIALLRRAHAAGQYRQTGSAESLRSEPDFAALRGRSEFDKFLAKLGK